MRWNVYFSADYVAFVFREIRHFSKNQAFFFNEICVVISRHIGHFAMNWAFFFMKYAQLFLDELGILR